MSKNLSHIPDFDKIIKLTIKDIDRIHIPYLKEIEGSTKQRIHNKGKDSEGNTIGVKNKRHGRYSPGYEKRKGKIAGGHLYPINLQLHGDLLKSFTVGTKAGAPVLEFNDTAVSYPAGKGFDGKPSTLAAIHEKTYKTEIYKPSKAQLQDAEEVLELGVRDALKRTLNKIV